MHEPSPSAGDLGTSEPDAVRDARDILADLVEWSLPAGRWTGVEKLLHTVEAAIAIRDPAALARAVAGLELAGPDRIERITTSTDRTASPAVRERVGRIVDAMTGTFPPAGSAPPTPPGR